MLRLENVNGMLEVIYDERDAEFDGAGQRRHAASQGGGGMYSVEYGPR